MTTTDFTAKIIEVKTQNPLRLTASSAKVVIGVNPAALFRLAVQHGLSQVPFTISQTYHGVFNAKSLRRAALQVTENGIDAVIVNVQGNLDTDGTLRDAGIAVVVKDASP
jgi:hypothetical protein